MNRKFIKFANSVPNLHTSIQLRYYQIPKIFKRSTEASTSQASLGAFPATTVLGSPMYGAQFSNTEVGIPLRTGLCVWEALVLGIEFGVMLQNLATTFLMNFVVSTMVKDIRCRLVP